MATPQEIRDIVHAYVGMMCSNDIDSIMGLYADDATAKCGYGVSAGNAERSSTDDACGREVQ